ncbi:MAG: DUF2156 domain-containing protein [Treponema sp.]|nr:DUF2156 domain-containing protein [Treponema sp.]
MNPVDFGKLIKNLNKSELYGCDCCPANLFLLQQNNKVVLEIHENVLFRYFSIDENLTGYGFPIPMKNSSRDFSLKDCVAYILEQSKLQKRKLSFCFITEEQKNQLDSVLTGFFNLRVLWQTDRSDSDYIYEQKNLAELSGSDYQKKRNHISRFKRIYGERWTFRSFPENDISNDILRVAQKWFEENDSEEKEMLLEEQDKINIILKNALLFSLKGGVLYVDEKPVAMTLAAEISEKVLDVLFEKAIGEYAKNGAYAVINNQFASICSDYVYLNREEDLGIEGLRKAKLSYKPSLLLEKFHGSVTGA